MVIVTEAPGAGGPSTKDLTFGDDAKVVMVEGRSHYRAVDIPGLDHLSVYLRGELAVDGMPQEEAVAEALRDESWAHQDGRFSVLYFDHRRQRLTVAGDRFALVPVYCLVRSEAIYLSTTLHDLVARGGVDGTWNLEALSEILAFNFPLDGKTLLAGVTALGTGRRWTFELRQGQFSEETVWDPATLLAGPRSSFEDLQDELISNFSDGVRRLTAGHAAIGTTLSGGIDSRCLLAATGGLSGELSAYHVSVRGSRSEIYARRIADMRRLPLTVLSVDEGFAAGYFDKLKNIVRISEGMSFNSEAEGHYLRDHVDGPTVMLHGGFAELSKMEALRRYHVGEGLMAQPAAEVGAYLWPRWQRRFENRLRVLTPDLRSRVAEAARDHLTSLCRKISEVNPELAPEDVVQCYFLQHAIAVERYSALVWNDAVTTHFPFASPKYLDTLLRVRSRDRLEQKFQMAFLRTQAPELYDFPDANTGLHITAPAWRRKIQWFVEKVQVKLLQRKYLLEHGDFPAWMSNMQPPPEDVLLPNLDPQLFDAEILGQVIQQSKTSPRAGDVVEPLLMLQLWRQRMG